MILLTNVIQSLWLKNKVKREEGYLPVAAPALPGQEELLRLPLARDNGWWPASLCLSSPCLALESGKAHWTTINCITSLDGLEISTEMHLYWKALDWNVSVNMALCSVVFSPFSPFSAGSHPLELAPPPPPCSRETNLHFHLHTTLQRTIRTWMSLSCHCTGGENVSYDGWPVFEEPSMEASLQNSISRPLGCLYQESGQSVEEEVDDLCFQRNHSQPFCHN